MFIKLNENNEIIASANFKVDNTFIATDRNIVRNWDGKLVFDGEETERPLEQLKQEKLTILDNETQKFIYSEYPIYKQLNIINPLNDYSEEDRNNMNEFINEVRNKNHSLVEQINNCTTKEELDLININFE